jgi:hypothetical protein
MTQWSIADAPIRRIAFAAKTPVAGSEPFKEWAF